MATIGIYFSVNMCWMGLPLCAVDEQRGDQGFSQEGTFVLFFYNGLLIFGQQCPRTKMDTLVFHCEGHMKTCARINFVSPLGGPELLLYFGRAHLSLYDAQHG